MANQPSAFEYFLKHGGRLRCGEFAKASCDQATSRDGVFSEVFLLPVEIPLAVVFPFGYAKETRAC